MEIRERLLRNEILHLAGDLRAVSQELITLQDFIRKEFGAKYVRFCDARKGDSEGKNESEEFHNSLSNLRQSDVPFLGEDSPRNLSARLRSSATVSQTVTSTSSTSLKFDSASSSMSRVDQFQDEGDMSSDLSNPAMFPAWKTEPLGSDEEEEDLDLYIPGCDDDETDPDYTMSHNEGVRKRKSETETDESVASKKRRRVMKWVTFRSFESKQIAEDFLKTEKTWVYQNKYQTKESCNIRYGCSKASKCPAARRIVVMANCSKVEVYMTNAEHEHEEKILKKAGISPDVKEVIVALFEQHGLKKPSMIICELEKRSLPPPTVLQIRNFLAAYRAKVNPSDPSSEVLEPPSADEVLVNFMNPSSPVQFAFDA